MTTIHAMTAGLSAFLLTLAPASLHAHPGHHHDGDSGDHATPFVASNWGRLLYRDADEYSLPADDGLEQHLVKNHGGSVTDPVTSALYTTIGAKVIRFSIDSGEGAILEDSERFGQGNFHGLAIARGGPNPDFYFADNERHLVRFRSYADASTEDLIPGKALHEYFTKGGSFNPTDVELHPRTGNPWPFDGYGSNLVFDALHTDFVFGGKDVFRTAHGGAFHDDTLVVCSRGSGEICTVDEAGEVTERFLVSKGSMPCDIDFIGDFALVGCLRGPGTKHPDYPGAPCYIYHWPSKQLISTIVPKSDFGFEHGTHIHNAAWWPHIVDGKVSRLFIAFSFWNPGDFKLVEVKGLPLEWLPVVTEG